jgi:hypothetical protein
MATIDLKNPKITIITRPQNSVYQFIRFVDPTDMTTQVDLSAFNMYCTFRTADFLQPVDKNLFKDIKVKRLPRDPLGNPWQPIETGIYCLADDTQTEIVQGGDFELIINIFPSDIFPVGTYFIDWIIQRTKGSTKVLFTIELIVTNDVADSDFTTNAPFIQLPVSFVSPPEIIFPIQILQLPI